MMMELKHYAALTASAYTRRNVVGKQTSVKEAACRLTTDDDVKALSQIYSSYFDSRRTDFIRSVGGLILMMEQLPWLKQHKYRNGLLGCK
jgi:hypothetical protein